MRQRRATAHSHASRRHRVPSRRRGPPNAATSIFFVAVEAQLGPEDPAGVGVVSMRGANQDESKLSTPLLCCHGRALAQRSTPFSWQQTMMANSQVQVQLVGDENGKGGRRNSSLRSTSLRPSGSPGGARLPALSRRDGRWR